MNGPVGMEFGAVLAMGQALRADQEMLAELLPAVEAHALALLSGGDKAEEEDDGE